MARIGRVLDSTIPIGVYNLGISGGSNNQIVSFGSNGEPYYTTFLRSLRADGTLVLGPDVALASGSNITLTLDRGPLPTAATSNTVRIHSTGGSVSAGSNATRVSEIPLAGVAATYSPSDHQHDGIGTIVSNSSNTLQRGTFNLKTGNNISFGLTDSDGDGELDTVQIHSTGAGGGGAASGGGWVWLQTQTGSSSAQLDFTSFITSTYDEYIFEFVNILPATNDVAFRMRMGTGGGPTYDTGANYSWNLRIERAGGAASTGSESGDTFISLNYQAGGTLGVNSTTNHGGWSGYMRLFDPGGSIYKQVQYTGRYYDAEPFRLWVVGRGAYESTTAVTAVRFYMSTGNIASGVIRCYGVSKS